MTKDKNSKEVREGTKVGEHTKHPVGFGTGGAAGAVAGGAAGSVAGPVGTVVGAVAGGVAGAMAGESIAAAVNPEVEDAYWKENYTSRPYVDRNTKYDTYAPAYRAGYMGFTRYGEDRTFDEAESDLQRDYESSGSGLPWDRARHATRDAWDRVESNYFDSDAEDAEDINSDIDSGRSQRPLR